MNKQLAGSILALLIIVVGGLRLIFALSTPYLSFEGYQEARYVQEILSTGMPLREDLLSFGGREHVYSPVYYYFIAPFALMGVELALKIIPNLLYLLAIALVYLIAHEVSKNRTASVLATVLAALTPITFSAYINNGSPFTLAIPLFLAFIYGLLEPKKRVPLLLIAGIALSLISPLTLLLLAGIAVFLLLMHLEDLQTKDSYSEIILFLLFFSLWTTMIFFKDVFFENGITSVWTAVPSLSNEITLLSIIGIVGALPLIFASHATYYSLFIRRGTKVILLIAMSLTVSLSLFLKILPTESGAVILTFLLSILSAHSIGIILRYFEKTKAPKLQYFILSFVLVFFLFASFFPALSLAQNTLDNTPTDDHYEVAAFLTNKTILAAPQEGFFFQYYGAKTMTDTNVLLVDAQEYYSMTEEVYRARFVLPVLEAKEEYGFEYIVFSEITQEQYARQELLFLNECFRPVFGTETIEVYEVRCNVKKS